MDDGATGNFRIEWRPVAHDPSSLTLVVELRGRTAVRRFASRLGAPASMRISGPDGTSVTASADAVLRWAEGDALPTSDAEWRDAPRGRDDVAQAVDLLEAFLAWTKSRGVLDEASAARISRLVQMEMAGAAPDTPR